MSKIKLSRIFSSSPILTKSNSISSNPSHPTPKPSPSSPISHNSNSSKLNQILKILSTKHSTTTRYESDDDLTQLGLKLNEKLIWDVSNHSENILSFVKFFDWAGRQKGYQHNESAFLALSKMLAKEKVISNLDFNKFERKRYGGRYYQNLVLGYVAAGEPDIALELFGKMRNQGHDLDEFAYNLFLNALVEQRCFRVVDSVFKQIMLRGLESETSSRIMVKCFCKQNMLEKAVEFLRGLESRGVVVSDCMVGDITEEYCKRGNFEEAEGLLEEFRGCGKVSLTIWSNSLVKVGKVEKVLEFLESKKIPESHVPDLFRCNTLICRLLKENRLDDVFDILTDMMGEKLSFDRVIVSVVCGFFCKAGMVDVALKLYNSRSDDYLSVKSISYNYLMNTVCGDGSIEEIQQLLKDSIKQGYFPRQKTVSVLADALCNDGKLDKMEEIIVTSLELNIIPNDAVFSKFVLAVCKSRRMEDWDRRGYTCFDLVSMIDKVKRGDLAATLLIVMQENGQIPSRYLYKAVIRCICNMDDPENDFFRLLEMQLTRGKSVTDVYNFFIDGAGHSKRPDLAMKVFEMMGKNGVIPNNDSNILLLKSYLKSDNIPGAQKFYIELCKDGLSRIHNVMIIGLSKANKPLLALEIFKELREKGKLFSKMCYEELALSLCSNKNYSMAREVIDELLKTDRKPSSYLCDILDSHSIEYGGNSSDQI